MIQLIYGLLFVVTVFGALGVLLNKNTVYSAVCLVGVMVALAANYLLMHLEFVAFIQVIVYAGAIMVLFLFVIMLLNLREKESPPWYLRNARRWGFLLAAIFFFYVAWGVQLFAPVTTKPGALENAEKMQAAGTPEVIMISTLMVTKYSLPFLLTSVLLLVAVIGAIVMAKRHDEEAREIVFED